MSRRDSGYRVWQEDVPYNAPKVPKPHYQRRSAFIVKNIGNGYYEVTSPSGYWWHIVREVDGQLIIDETDCTRTELSARALRSVTNIT